MRTVRLAVSLLSREPTDVREMIEQLSAGEAKRIARRWLAQNAPTRHDDAIQAVLRAVDDRDAARSMVARLGNEQRALLSIVARYGGRVSGELFGAELDARKLFAKRSSQPYRMSDPTHELRDRGLLFLGLSEWSYPQDEFREMVCAPGVLAAVSPAAGVPWPRRPLGESVAEAYSRAPDAIALEMLAVARTCESVPRLDTNVGGALSVSTRKRLQKPNPAFADDGDPLLPPSRIDLAWELLRGLGIVDLDGPVVALHLSRADELLAKTEAEISFALTRCWLEARHWQDGLGAVPEKDSNQDFLRYAFDEMRTQRELLAWSLGRLALWPPTWVELEPFLLEFHRETRRKHLTYGVSAPLRLQFEAARGAEDMPCGSEERSRAFWLRSDGELIGNMLLVTLVHFGLVERGRLPGDRWAFRLTEVGREVFGAPDVVPAQAAGGDERETRRALVVQADFEVLLHARDADRATRATLARIATLVAAGDRVSRFRLEAASVRSALTQGEAGMSGADIHAFLRSASRTDVPKVVSVAIDEWTSERETVRLHGPGYVVVEGDDARIVGEHEFIRAAKGRPELDPRVSMGATLDERGHVTCTVLDTMSEARLARIAERTAGGFALTRERVVAAGKTGITEQQILEWLQAIVERVPALFRKRLAHWLAGRTTPVHAERHTFLRIDDDALEISIAASPTFHALGVVLVGRGFLRVDDARLAEVVRELAEFGIVVTEAGAEASPPKRRRAKR
ncbi:MAG: helicase-associated domain-containing protein [Deltaproteobacteria bacterium]|nr:helicase-associated domain-containing protein [Deltaproteobacteria bacterium]